MLILRLAWLNLWDKHMTTGRINQVNNSQHCSSLMLHTKAQKTFVAHWSLTNRVVCCWWKQFRKELASLRPRMVSCRTGRRASRSQYFIQVIATTFSLRAAIHKTIMSELFLIRDDDVNLFTASVPVLSLVLVRKFQHRQVQQAPRPEQAAISAATMTCVALPAFLLSENSFQQRRNAGRTNRS
jgi:hypothetical protein